MKNKSWYSIKNTADSLDVSIHDEIGARGISAKGFIQDISNFKGSQINVSIHSPGGSVFDGVAMHIALRDHSARVVTRVEGVAASAATLPFMAGDERHMPDNTYLMIHNPWTVAGGDAAELRNTANFLDRIKSNLVDIYGKDTGIDDAQLDDMLNSETWLDSTEAKNFGFATHIDESVKVAALTKDFEKYFAKVPDSIKPDSISIDKINPDNITNIQEFEKFLRDVGGFSNTASKSVIAVAKTVFRREGEDVKAKTLDTLKNFTIN